MLISWRVQSRSMRLIKRLENVHYFERLKKANLFNNSKRKSNPSVYLDGKTMLLIETSH